MEDFSLDAAAMAVFMLVALEAWENPAYGSRFVPRGMSPAETE
jgi:hypothetical protein